MTLHIDQWIEGSARQRFFLLDETTKKERVLSHRPVNRHRDFDIKKFLKPGHSYSLHLVMEDKVPGKVFVDELNVRVFPGVPYFPPLDLILAAAFFTGLVLTRVLERRPFLPLHHWETVSILVLIALAFRWRVLGAAFGQPLEGDAGAYRDLALALSWKSPFQNGIREPFYIWVQNIGSVFWGTGLMKFRITTLLLSLASIPLLYFFCLATTNRRAVAVCACLLMACGEYAVIDAVRGERSQLFTFLMLAFSLGVVRMAPLSRKREALLGGLGGLLSWTWLAGALGVVLAYLCRWVHWKVPLKNVVFFWVVLSLMVGGFLFQQKQYRGDPLQSLNAHVNFYKNAKETGLPSYAGEKSNWFHYFWQQEGAMKVVSDSVKGTFDLFLNPTNPFNKIFLGFHYSQPYSYVLFPFLIAGLALTLYRREYWGWLLMFSFLNISGSMLRDVRDPRLFYHLMPFFAYFFAVGFVDVVTFSRSLLISLRR